MRINKFHIIIGKHRVAELPDDGFGRYAVVALVPAVDGGDRQQTVQRHKNTEDDRDDLACFFGDLLDQIADERIQIAQPHQPQKAPDERKHQVGPAVDIKRRVAVIPADGAQKLLLKIGAEIFKGRADDRRRDVDDHVALAVQLVQAKRDRHGADAVDRNERSQHPADAHLKVSLGKERPKGFEHGAEKAADDKQPKELGKAESVGKGSVLLALDPLFIHRVVPLAHQIVVCLEVGELLFVIKGLHIGERPDKTQPKARALYHFALVFSAQRVVGNTLPAVFQQL